MSLAKSIAGRRPHLKKKLYMAGIDMLPEAYVQLKMRSAIIMSIMLGLLALMFFAKRGNPVAPTLLVLIFSYILIFNLLMKEVDSKITKLAKEIDKDVLFAGRFLLVKLNSGRPLINAIEDASKSYGLSNEYFKEIIRDIDLGTPLEKALEKATRNCPSDKLRKILFQITNALKIGTDVTNFLDAILDDIADQQLIEIKRYGKKLNSITMFYMLFAVVMPSLGMTMLIVIISLVNVPIVKQHFLLVLILLIFLQFIFITTFRNIRPNMNI